VALAIKAAATAETPNFEDAVVDSGDDVSALWRSYVDSVLGAVGGRVVSVAARGADGGGLFFCLVVDGLCAEAVGFMLKTGPNTRNAEGRPPLPRIDKFLMPKRLRAVWRVLTTAARRALYRLPPSGLCGSPPADRLAALTPRRRCGR
jgi:hypothetical protein